MRAGTLGAASAVTLALLTPVSASATESIALAGSQPGQRTIELNREQSGKLAGELWLVVTRKGPPAKLKLQFSSISPIGKSEAPWVKFARGVEPTVSGTKPTRVQLSFSLPADASPEDLEGLVRLLPVVHGHPSRNPVEVSAGVGDALAGVSLEPASVTLQVEKSAPWNEPGKVGASVQLSGPGVPRLLARPRYPGFDLLLQSDHGHALQARLTKLTKVSATVASARISVKGPFHIGTYEGAGPMSDLSPKSPSLTIKLTSGDSFIWPLILAFAGSLVGGALYLASGVRRRRMLLRKETKAILGRYLDTVQKRKDSAPLWPLDEYLGDKADWYKVMWNAAAQLDGAVRALWSSIHWARTDADLDAAAKELLELRTRIIRWLTAAKSVDGLATVSKMELPAVMEAAWDTTHTVGDTRDLLTIVKEVAPPTDEATASLIDRLTRQAHWHERFAGAWYAKSVLMEAMDSQTYLHKDHLKVQNIDLEALDAKASPESGRKPEMQVQLERDLTTAMRQIRGLYHGQASDLTLPDGGPVAGATVAFTTDAVFGAVDRSAMARVPPSDPAGTADERNPNTEWLTILARDLPWTLAVTAVSSAAYVPTIFSTTWGRPSDYVSAFAAGFVGKVVVNWGALPLFQSLRGSAGGQTQTGGSSAAAA